MNFQEITTQRRSINFFAPDNISDDQLHEIILLAAKSLYDWSPEASPAFAAKSCGCFAMSLIYAATSLGSYSHTMDGFDHEEVRKQFNIQDNY